MRDKLKITKVYLVKHDESDKIELIGLYKFIDEFTEEKYLLNLKRIFRKTNHFLFDYIPIQFNMFIECPNCNFVDVSFRDKENEIYVKDISYPFEIKFAFDRLKILYVPYYAREKIVEICFNPSLNKIEFCEVNLEKQEQIPFFSIKIED
ncbi:MAG: hypothetical protein ACK4GJ_05810 [bacterium]